MAKSSRHSAHGRYSAKNKSSTGNRRNASYGRQAHARFMKCPEAKLLAFRSSCGSYSKPMNYVWRPKPERSLARHFQPMGRQKQVPSNPTAKHSLRRKPSHPHKFTPLLRVGITREQFGFEIHTVSRPVRRRHHAADRIIRLDPKMIVPAHVFEP